MLLLQLLTTDALPKTVCLECCAKLNQCTDFCETSSQAQLTLHMIYTTTTTKEEEMDDEDIRDVVGDIDEEYDSGSSVEEEEEEEEEELEEEEEEEVQLLSLSCMSLQA